MEIFLIYILISLLILYILYRINYESIEKEQYNKYGTYIKHITDTNTFWNIMSKSFFWFIIYPFKFIKWILDKTLGRFVDEYLKDIKV